MTPFPCDRPVPHWNTRSFYCNWSPNRRSIEFCGEPQAAFFILHPTSESQNWWYNVNMPAIERRDDRVEEWVLDLFPSMVFNRVYRRLIMDHNDEVKLRLMAG